MAAAAMIMTKTVMHMQRMTPDDDQWDSDNDDGKGDGNDSKY